jgi:hypothetical protein
MLLTGCLLSTGTAAQIAAGDRVRIDAAEPGPGRFTGTVLRPTRDWIAIRTDTGQVVIPLRAINRIEMSLGLSHRKAVRRGMNIGGLVGLAAGILIAVGWDCQGAECIMAPVIIFGAPLGLALGGGAVGALIGYGVGNQWPSEDWQRVAPTPAKDGVSIGISLSVGWNGR